VGISSWSVETLDGATHHAKPGSVYRACASNPVHAIDALGNVHHARKGTAFKEIWSVRGKVSDVFHVSWSKSGDFKDSFGIAANSGALTTGKWKLKLVQGGRQIGGSTITIRKKPGC
jgi:hypothetical protein